MQFNLENFINILIITGIIIAIIWITQLLLNYFIKRKFKKSKKLPRDAINGLQYVIQFIAAIIILFISSLTSE